MNQKILIIINDAPYGTEKAYNGFRLALQLGREHPGTEVRVFLMADAAACAVAGQQTPEGFYNIERMLRAVLAKGGQVKVCGSCAAARGLRQELFVEGAEISNMTEFAAWVTGSDKVVTF